MKQKLFENIAKVFRSFSFVDHHLDAEEILFRRKELILYSVLLVISIILILDV